MESPNRRYISQVDEIRGMAALLVLFFHSTIIGYWQSGHTGWIRARNSVEALLIEGHSGVALFMVLSGYILAKGAIGRKIVYRDFLIDRVIRIFPLMTVVAVAAIYAKTDITLQQILAPFLLVQNIIPLSLTEPSGIAAQLWTMSVEFQFYLIAPFLFLFVSRYGFKEYVLPLVALVICLRAFMLFEHRDDATFLWQYPYFSIVGRIDQFVIGILLAWRWDDLAGPGDKPRARSAAALVAGLGGMMLLSYAENVGGGQYAWHWWRLPQQEIEGVLWASFIFGYVLLDPLSPVRPLKTALTSVGVISFSFYILHWSVMSGVFQTIALLGMRIPERHAMVLAITACVTLPVVLAVATLSYLCIERPFLQLRRRYVVADATASLGQAAR